MTAQEVLMVCGECDHYWRNTEVQGKGCCMLYGKDGALSTYPLDPMSPAYECESFTHDGKTFRLDEDEIKKDGDKP